MYYANMVYAAALCLSIHTSQTQLLYTSCTQQIHDRYLLKYNTTTC